MADALAYRPCNGTEGDLFFSCWCDCCARNDGGCEILSATMLFRVTDRDYPPEWRTDEAHGPRCTAFDALDPFDQPFDPAAAIGLLL